MRRNSCLRLLGVVSVIAMAAAYLPAAAVPSAHADTLLQQKKAKLQRARAEVKKLDATAEKITLQYNEAVYRLGVLHKQIVKTTAQLVAAEAELKRDEQILRQLLVTQYKGGNTQIFAIVLGARHISQVTNAIDYARRTDQAVGQTVAAIHQLRDEIAAHRVTLIGERKAERKQRDILAARRIEVAKLLRQRKAIVSELGVEVLVIEGAKDIGQANLALKARKWIKDDMVANKKDPGQVMRDKTVLEGLQQIGVPYVWGGASPKGGFDCSGLVLWLWAQQGLTLDHFAATQYDETGPPVEVGPTLDLTKLKIGDLLFFHQLGHVGIYAGNGLILHAPHTGDVVRLESLTDPWFVNTFVGATQPGPA